MVRGAVGVPREDRRLAPSGDDNLRRHVEIDIHRGTCEREGGEAVDRGTDRPIADQERGIGGAAGLGAAVTLDKERIGVARDREHIVEVDRQTVGGAVRQVDPLDAMVRDRKEGRPFGLGSELRWDAAAPTGSCPAQLGTVPGGRDRDGIRRLDCQSRADRAASGRAVCVAARNGGGRASECRAHSIRPWERTRLASRRSDFARESFARVEQRPLRQGPPLPGRRAICIGRTRR